MLIIARINAELFYLCLNIEQYTGTVLPHMEKGSSFSSSERTGEMSFMERALRFEGIINDIRRVNKSVESSVFKSEQGALSAKNILIAGVNDRLAAIGGVEDIELRLTGDRTFVPNTFILRDEGDDSVGPSIGFRFDAEESMRELNAFESVTGIFKELVGTVVETDDGRYGLHLYIVSELRPVETATVTANLGGRDHLVVSAVFFQGAITRLTTDDGVEIEYLHKERERRTELAEAARRGVIRGALRRQLSRIGQALHQENVSDFIPLKKLDMLQKIGEIGTEEVRADFSKSTVIGKAILHTIGKERALRVFYREDIGIRSVAGKLVEVLMPLSEDDSMPPSLVIEGKSNDGPPTGGLYQVELNSIYDVRF